MTSIELSAYRAAYRNQKKRALARGIAWEFNFDDWLDVWQKSGRINQRGRKKDDFCMARNGDVGPYAAWNVQIQTCSQNTRDGRFVGSDTKRAVARSITCTGLGKGWAYVRGRYQVYRGKSYVGVFYSEEEARAAYVAACEIHKLNLLESRP